MFLHFNLGSMLPPKQVANTARSALGRQEWARWVEPVLGSLSARVQSVQPARMHQAYWQRYHYDLISQEQDKMPELCASDELPHTLRGAKSCHPHCGQGPQFLLLGGSVREWKISVLLELARRDLLSHGRFSSGTHPVCEDSTPSARCDFPDVVSSDTCRRLFSNASLVRAVCAMLPRALDLTLARDTATIVAMERSTARDLWRDADFGLVFETTMYPFEGTVPSSFVTEKMLKPIFNARPFLSLGSIGELATLRALGFRTFEPFINESYDQIPNPDARMRAVLDETERLLSMRRDQWRRTAQGLSEAALHNARHVYCGGYMRTMQAHVLDTIEYAFLASADTQTRAGTNA